MIDLSARLKAILVGAPGLMRVLTVTRDLQLPDWLVFSGAVYQPVWNHLTGRPIEHGIRDYDLAYFDAADTSYDAEDRVIRRVAAAFEPPLRDMVEVRNQARVHLWFEDHFGEAYSPLANTAEALARFTAATFAVGVRLRSMTIRSSSPPSASKTCSPCACAPTLCAHRPVSRARCKTPRRDGRRSRWRTRAGARQGMSDDVAVANSASSGQLERIGPCASGPSTPSPPSRSRATRPAWSSHSMCGPPMTGCRPWRRKTTRPRPPFC